MQNKKQNNQSLTISQFSKCCDLTTKSNNFAANADFSKRIVAEIYGLLALDQKLSAEDYQICNERFKVLENTIQEIRNAYTEDNNNSCS